MISIVRFYTNAEKANKAVKDLKAGGFAADAIHHLKPGAEAEADVAARVRTEVEAGRVPEVGRDAVRRALGRSRHVVAVNVIYGQARPAMDIMDACDPVDEELVPESYSSLESARLMSEALGLPMISARRHFLVPGEGGLAGFRFVFANLLGLRLTSNKAAPLSDTVGMKTVTERKKDWRTSMGLALQAGEAAPLSNKLGMKTVLALKPEWTSSFGLPLLSGSAAPFSKAFGLPLLSAKKR